MATFTPEEMRAGVLSELIRAASNGCDGAHDGTCSDPEMEINPKDWCNECLMGFAAAQLDSQPRVQREAVEAFAKRVADITDEHLRTDYSVDFNDALANAFEAELAKLRETGGTK